MFLNQKMNLHKHNKKDFIGVGCLNLLQSRLFRFLLTLTVNISVAVIIGYLTKFDIVFNIMIAIVWAIGWLIKDIKEERYFNSIEEESVKEE